MNRRGCGRWDAVVAALDDWPKTLRLIMILFAIAMRSSGSITAVIMVLAHHVP
jgi:hypothetical protein